MTETIEILGIETETTETEKIEISGIETETMTEITETLETEIEMIGIIETLGIKEKKLQKMMFQQ